MPTSKKRFLIQPLLLCVGCIGLLAATPCSSNIPGPVANGPETSIWRVFLEKDVYYEEAAFPCTLGA
jgi:hypothetical protein